jgi:hypothetical protein
MSDQKALRLLAQCPLGASLDMLLLRGVDLHTIAMLVSEGLLTIRFAQEKRGRTTIVAVTNAGKLAALL